MAMTVRQTAEIGDVEQAVVRRAVLADKPARSMQKITGKSCSADVVMDAVVGALEEGE
jgi:L-lactate utilization protein LutC